MKYLAEKTALKEFKSKYGYTYDIKENDYTEILFSIYHTSYETIKNNIKENYKNTFDSLTKEQWLYHIDDMQAIVSQLSEHNYNILLSDIEN